MQTRQSTASVGSRVQRKTTSNVRAANGDQIFSNPNQNIEDKLKGNTEDAPYFQRRMMKNRGSAGQPDAKDAE